jgi:WXXGXW repeat (2 copies)
MEPEAVAAVLNSLPSERIPMKPFRSSVFALLLGAAVPAYFVAPANAQIAVDISVDVAPPPLPYYEQPPIPAEGYIWAPGYWAWDAAILDYYWVPGTWVEPPQPELLWTPAWWGWDGGRYGFHPGYWGREVGFYGGVDYGYGYTGDGYYGGRWDHGVFFYNRTVNNFTNVRVTNVYEQTVVINNNASRVSFNGGNGGIQMRATAQQETLAREHHVEATPVQRQHAETASKDRSLFSKQNHGEPPVAATPRAGVLQGPGVERASRTPTATPGEPGRAGQPQGAEGREPPRPGQEPARPGEPPRAGEPPRPSEPPRPNEAGHEPPPPAGSRTPAEEPRRAPEAMPKEAPRAEPPRAEPRPEARPEPPRPAQQAAPPRVEERRPEPPPAAAPREAPREMPREAPREAPHAAPPPPPRPAAPPAARPAAPAGHPPAREEEKR